MSDKSKTTEKTEKKSGKGFFDKLKSMAFETSGDENEQSEDNSNSSSNTGSNDSQTSKFVYSTQTPVNTGMPNVNGQFDQRFYEGLVKVMEDNNIDGVDYLEFKRGKQAMDSIAGMAEPVKYQSTYAQLQANSPGKKIEKDYILKTADFYIEKLDQEESEFNAEMQKEINNEVISRNQQVQEKTDAIKKKQEQIAALNAEINTLNAEIGQTQNEAQLAQAKIEATAKNFKVTLEVFKSQIVLDKQNIQQFIQ